MKRIQAIIWDFGNILARFDHLKACKRFADFCELAPEDLFEIFFSGERAPGKLHESGQISSQEFFQVLQERAHFSPNLSFQEFSNIWKDIFQENAGIGAVIDRTRSEVKQCILSNTDPIHWLAIEQLPVMKKHFSDPAMLVRSYTSGARKPDPKIYGDALTCLSLDQKEIGSILYIDDVSEYRDAFERMGGKVLSYDCSKDPLSRLETALREFGVLRV